MLKIGFKRLHQDAVLPEYKTLGAAGCDLHAVENVDILPGQTAVVKLGFSVSIPPTYEIQIRPRSGLAAKNSVTVLNSPGTIDSDYRGEVMVILANLGKQDFHVRIGDRIAQAVVAPVKRAFFDEKSELSSTERGEDGFGSTGR